MFNEDEDWSDEQDTQPQSKAVLRAPEQQNNSTSVKTKLVGKKSLLRTLQTLGSVPEWKSDTLQQDSDSEAEAAPSHPRKKKKKRKKRKHAETSEEREENGDSDQSVSEEKPGGKKRNKDNKFGAPKVKTTSAGDKEMTESAETNINTPGNPERLSRQQWKNKMKNKKNCKNKYRQKEPEEEENKQNPKEEAKTDSNSNNNSGKIPQPASQKKKREQERKPQKRKNTEEDTGMSRAPEIQTLREEKQMNEKVKKTEGSKVERGVTVFPADGCEPDVKIAHDPQPSPAKRLKPELSREQNLKRERLRKMLQRKETERQEIPVEQKVEPAAVPAAAPEAEVKQDRSASLRSRMEQRLESARFRYINEVLYSTSSGEAKRMFRQDPQAFWVYHRGYTAQVQRWPANPVDGIISYIQRKPASLVVADFGCGDCKIARSVKNKVHSFDLAAACELVTVCDMANVPLADRSVDIAVFCLSLMGTNLADFLAEANRVLKMSGVLKVAEVASRFDNVRNFINALASLGFKLVSKDAENTHFYSFEFVKTGDAPENIKKFGLQLKACVYKKR